MVNVAALSMAMARSLDLEGPMLREFGFAALMHDIGKVHTPLEILNKPDKLTDEEFTIMKLHVVDGAHMLRRTPETPALAPVVAFEHHLKQDLSGYPENIGSRKLNLCTMVVSVVDVFDALRSNRAYRAGLATDRIRHIMGQQDGTAFNSHAAAAVRQPDGAVPGRHAGPLEHGRGRRGHPDASGGSVPAAGEADHSTARARPTRRPC